MSKLNWAISLVTSTEFWSVMTKDFTKKKYPVKSREEHLKTCINWLKYGFKQTNGRGFPICFIPKTGRQWSEPFVETTGYIIETMLEYSRMFNDNESKDMAIKAADWLLSIQNADGSFASNEGHYIPVVSKPLIFDTGQDLFGLVEAYKETKDQKYLNAALRGARWLLSVQDSSGAFIQFTFKGHARTYYIRVAWAMLEVAIASGDESIKQAALKNYDWALKNHLHGDFMKEAAFMLNDRQFLHLIGYVIRSLHEGARLTQREDMKNKAFQLLDKMIMEYNKNKVFAGDYNEKFVGDYSYRCLTGEAQLANAAHLAYQSTGDKKYAIFISDIIDGLSAVQNTKAKNIGLRGLQGSLPFWAPYEKLHYPNWAVKFFAECIMREMKIKAGK